jgi:hypothetical protein
MSKGERANEPVVMYGHREVVLESTDDTPSWAPGHADFKCLVCGLTAESHHDMQRKECTPSEVETG